MFAGTDPMQRSMAVTRCALVLTLLLSCGRVPQADAADVSAGPLRVAAAASLAPVMAELGPAFARESAVQVVFSFGSSGLLARQVVQGAPFDVFVSADEEFADYLIREGAAAPATRAIYARGTLDLWWRADLAVAPPKQLGDLADPRFKKIALANPAHAPYGRAARQALTKLGLWAALLPRLVNGENVQQALQFAQTGNAEVALVAHALAVGSTAGHSLAVDSALYSPIDQALVVCAQTQQPVAARAFTAFVLGKQGRAILAHHGLLPPGQGPAGGP